MSRPDFSVCVCPDSHLLGLHIDKMLQAHSQAGQWKRFIFWGDEALPNTFWEHLTLQSLFATPKALIIRNAQNITADGLRQLSEAILRNTSKSLWPIFCFEVPFEKGRPKLAPHIPKIPFFAHAEAHKFVDYLEGLTPQNFSSFIQEQATRLNLKLSSAETSKLSAILPLNAMQTSTELAKLALCTDKTGQLQIRIEEAISHTPELGIFELLSSIQQNKGAPAVWRRIIEDQIQGENMVFAFNAILLREARQLWQILAGEPVYLPSHVASAKRNLAKTLGFAGIAKIWEHARKADKGVKTGSHSPNQAFEILVADIFTLFAK